MQLAIGIFDLHVAFVQAAELQRSEIDVPEAVIDVLQPDIFAGTDAGDIDPVTASADPAIGADLAEFEAVGVFERWQAVGQGAWRAAIL